MQSRDSRREHTRYPEVYKESASGHAYADEARYQQSSGPPFGRPAPFNEYNEDTAPLVSNAAREKLLSSSGKQLGEMHRYVAGILDRLGGLAQNKRHCQH